MSRKSANGPVAFAGGQDTTDLVIDLVPASTALTNALLADGFFAADPAHMTKLDLAGVSQIRLTGHVTTAGAAAHKLQLRYSPTYTTTVASFLTMGESSVEISLAALGLPDSGWINILPAARINDCFVGLMSIGGDGAADPIVSHITAHFR